MDDKMNALSRLSSYVGAGLGDDSTTAAEFEQRIRDGIQHMLSEQVRTVLEKAADRAVRWYGSENGQLRQIILGTAIVEDEVPEWWREGQPEEVVTGEDSSGRGLGRAWGIDRLRKG